MEDLIFLVRKGSEEITPEAFPWVFKKEGKAASHRNAGFLGDVSRGTFILPERSGGPENEARSDPLLHRQPRERLTRQ